LDPYDSGKTPFWGEDDGRNGNSEGLEQPKASISICIRLGTKSC